MSDCLPRPCALLSRPSFLSLLCLYGQIVNCRSCTCSDKVSCCNHVRHNRLFHLPMHTRFTRPITVVLMLQQLLAVTVWYPGNAHMAAAAVIGPSSSLPTAASRRVFNERVTQWVRPTVLGRSSDQLSLSQEAGDVSSAAAAAVCGRHGSCLSTPLTCMLLSWHNRTHAASQSQADHC